MSNVSRIYDSGRVVALSGVTLEVACGEFLAILGPSGSGKSSLLNILSGLDRPSSGSVRVEGRQPKGSRAWAKLRARRIGQVFQSFHLLPRFTAQQNVELAMMGVVGSARQRRKRAEELLASVELADRMDHRPGELSVGQRQRVAIARALANEPVVLLADEPTGSLDSVSAAAVMDLLGELHRQRGMAMVLVTHDESIAASADRRIHLRDGRIAPADSSVQQVPPAGPDALGGTG